MDLTRTKKGLKRSTRRFRRARHVGTMGSFTGSIAPGFTTVISNQWRVVGPGLLRPARMDFRKYRNPFELVGLARARREQLRSYSFSPTIQVIFPFNLINDLLFETNAGARFQWLLSEINEHRPAAKTLLASSGTREFWRWPSIGPLAGSPRKVDQQVAEMRTLLPGNNRLLATLVKSLHVLRSNHRSRSTETLSLPYNGRLLESLARILLGRNSETLRSTTAASFVDERDLSGTLANTSQSGNGTSSWTMTAPLFLTIVRAAQHWTHSFKENLSQSTVWPVQYKNLPGGGILKPGQTLAWLRSIFSSRNLTWTSSRLQNLLKTVRAGNSAALRESSYSKFTVLGSRGEYSSSKLTGVVPREGDSYSKLTVLVPREGDSYSKFTVLVPREGDSYSKLTVLGYGEGKSNGGNSITNLSLTLVAPTPAGADMTLRQFQAFGLPSGLHYAGRESPQLAAIVNTLRDLRSAQSEIRKPAPIQLPSIEQLTSQVRQQLERELRIEKERRGL